MTPRPNFRTHLGVTALVAALAGCSAGYASQRDNARGYLRLELEPATTEIDIDEAYKGVANGWRGGVVPVTPGLRRLTLRADGYITQRFDIEVAAYEEVTLILRLEPVLEIPEDEEEKKQPAPSRTALRARR